MTDPAAAPDAATPPGDDQPKKPPFAFTGPGCRTDVRLGALLVLGAVFLWLWFGPTNSARIFLCGAPLLLWGIPLQALQARRGRPGYPWKLGLALTALAIPMCWDLRFREVPEGALHVQIIAPLLLATGAWILLWWPVSGMKPRPKTEDDA